VLEAVVMAVDVEIDAMGLHFDRDNYKDGKIVTSRII
jgi:hypothetical protein